MIDLRDGARDEPGGGRSGVAAKIVAIFEQAIASGELGPEAKLPPTRQLAELVGINHLTAARAYRALADEGLVASRVGSGTYVRPSAGMLPGDRGDRDGSAVTSDGPQGVGWQRYALPEEVETYGDRILAEMFSQAGRSDVIPLMVGYPGSAMFPAQELGEHARAALEEEGSRVHQYCAIEGLPELRQAIAAITGAQATGDVASDILVTTGARQALTLTCRAVLRAGDAVAVESPTFTGLTEALRDSGATLLGVPCDADGLDVEALEAVLARRELKMLALQTRLANPAGRDLSPPRRARLLELAREHGFFILEDGVYADLRLGGNADAPPPLRTQAPEHVIYVSSFSKTVSPGLRTGWVAASGPVFDRIVREKRNDDMHGPMLPQMVAARLISSGGYERQIGRAIEFHEVRAKAMVEAVAAWLGERVRMRQPLGGGHVWATLDPALGERRLYAEALGQGVSFLPGGAMFPERSRVGAMRLSYSYLDPDVIAEGVARLGRAMDSLSDSGARREAMPVT